jgi:hypothetical protein
MSSLSTYYYGAPLLGYFNQSEERIDSILSKSTKTVIVSRKDLVENEPCVVFETEIDHLKYRIWFAVEKNYHILKLSIFNLSSVCYEFTNNAFIKIDDVWIPSKCVVKCMPISGKQKKISEYRNERNQIIRDSKAKYDELCKIYAQ